MNESVVEGGRGGSMLGVNSGRWHRKGGRGRELISRLRSRIVYRGIRVRPLRLLTQNMEATPFELHRVLNQLLESFQ
jgi:hypothetical protein